MTIALETIGLEKRFDGLAVTNNLSLRIEAGARHALIGPNGAGKTTVINLLTGVLRPNAGHILLGEATSPRCRRTSACCAGCHGRSKSISCMRI